MINLDEWTERFHANVLTADHPDDATIAILRSTLINRYGHGGEPITAADLAELLGEGFHTALRKAGDSPQASAAYRAIADMSGAEWAAIIDFVAWGVALSLDLPKGDPA